MPPCSPCVQRPSSTRRSASSSPSPCDRRSPHPHRRRTPRRSWETRRPWRSPTTRRFDARRWCVCPGADHSGQPRCSCRAGWRGRCSATSPSTRTCLRDLEVALAPTDRVDGAERLLASGPDRVRRIQAAARATAGGAFLVATPAVRRARLGDPRRAGHRRRGRPRPRPAAPLGGAPRAARPGHAAVARPRHAPPDRRLRRRPGRPGVTLAPALVRDRRRRPRGRRRGVGGGLRRRAATRPATERQPAPLARGGGRRPDRPGRRHCAASHPARCSTTPAGWCRGRPGRTWCCRAAQERQLRALVDRYRQRSRVHDDWGLPLYPSPGVVALFSGPSGTGKTTSAEVIAARARGRALPGRPLGPGQQVHRRDREEPRADLLRRPRRQLPAALRRGRLPLRQPVEGQRRPRPLRQPRGLLPPPAPRDVRRLRRAHLQLPGQHRPTRSCAGSTSPCTSRCPSAEERDRIWERCLGRRSARGPRPRLRRRAVRPHRRVDPQRRTGRCLPAAAADRAGSGWPTCSPPWSRS